MDKKVGKRVEGVQKFPRCLRGLLLLLSFLIVFYSAIPVYAYSYPLSDTGKFTFTADNGEQIEVTGNPGSSQSGSPIIQGRLSNVSLSTQVYISGKKGDIVTFEVDFKQSFITKADMLLLALENGVLGGVTSALRVLCQPGDSIIIQSPTYIGFSHVAEDNGWNLVLNPLIQDEQGIWRIDYADLEEKLAKQHIHTAIFCSTHNPAGRVWERWEIEKLMSLYQKYDVYVISDEIWADLTMPGFHHTPTQMVSEDARMRTIAFYAPSKTFNLAGLIGSYHVIYNPYLRDRVTKTGKNTHYNSMNVLSMHALMAAYSPAGRQWVDELCQVLHQNLDYAVSFIQSNFKGVKVSMPEGTYMLFLDCTEWCREHNTDISTLQAAGIQVGVIWQDGRPFHGDCHIRMNLALPHSLVKEAFERLKTYVFV